MDSGEATMSIAIQPEMVRAYRIVGGPRRMTLDAAVRRYAQDLFRDRYPLQSATNGSREPSGSSCGRGSIDSRGGFDGASCAGRWKL